MAQHFNNHRRFYPLYHFILVPTTVVLIVYSFFNLPKDATYEQYALVGAFCLILLTALTSRVSALKAQDRAIRAEVALRHYILTGKMLPAVLRQSQIIALRFASDEECDALTARAVVENLSSTEIKKAIKQWKADKHRV